MRSKKDQNCRKQRRRLGNLQYETLEPRQVLAAPVAIDDSFAVASNATIDVSAIVANDSDAYNDALAITAVTQPANGSVALVGSEYQFTPSANFIGVDQFTYTVSDGFGETATATVNVLVNAPVDVTAARTQILEGVGNVLPSPTQPGRLLVHGPTAFSILDVAGTDVNSSLFAGATMGEGRVIAANDHQWLNLDRLGGDPSMAALYTNGIDWLNQSANGSNESKSAKILTFAEVDSAWLTDQGYTNVHTISRAELVSELVDADVLVGFLGSNVSAEQAAAVGDFVKNGGGLFVSDYGIGYQWWWDKPLEEAGGNQVLNQTGIAFTREISYSNAPVNVQPATEQLTAERISDLISGSAIGTAAEMADALDAFARIAEFLPRDSTVRAELNAAFAQHRLGMVQATPSNPISSDADQALLSAEAAWLATLAVEDITAHPTAEALFGDIPADAVRTDSQPFPVAVDRTGMIATGAYAVPGEVVTIEVPERLVGQGFTFRINGHVDNISQRSHWVRLPYGVSNTFAIDSTEIKIANAFGGTIYLDVGGQAAGERPNIGDVDLTITGAITAPTFELGKTTDQQWQALRLNPAPYAELISEGVAMSVPSAWIRDLDNPTALMTYWNDVVNFMDWVGNVETLRTGPERINVDVQISAGLLHAGYPIQGPTWASENLVKLEVLEERGSWGYLHELGHEKQRHNILGHGYNSAWTFDGDTEVTVNIFANAGLELKSPNSPTSGWGHSVYPDLVIERAAATINDATKTTFEDKDPYPFYFSLADGPWGWQGYRDVLSTYTDQYLNDRAALPQTNGAEKDQWLIRWSTATGYDMTEYMVDHWKLEVSQSAIDQVAAMNLPTWMPLAIERAAARQHVLPGMSTTLDFANLGVGLDGVATLVSVGTPAHGVIAQNADGTYDYRADSAFIGVDEFKVTYQSSSGNRQAFSIAMSVGIRGLRSEIYRDISGSWVSNLTAHENFPAAPDVVGVIDDFNLPANSGDNYGARVSGYLTVPVSGKYTFWIASDDQGQLWLSTDDTPENRQRIANVPQYTGLYQWDKYSSQRSVEIDLVGGQNYYIEALMKESGGGDNLSVAWSSADPAVDVVGIQQPAVIENRYLTAFGVDRAYANSLQVVNTNDAGIGSLRAAIEYANLLPGQQTITFHLPNSLQSDGSYEIALQTALPSIADSTVIDGTTQADYAGRPLIELDGSAISDQMASGFVVTSDASQIKGLAIGGFGRHGILLRDADRVTIENNYVGLDVQGQQNANGGAGINLTRADRNSILDNVISGNDFSGVFLSGDTDDNTIEGNQIGTDVDGQTAIANQGGVFNNGRRNKILDNLISGNDWAGVVLRNDHLGSDSVVQGNRIGVAENGSALGNQGYGILSQASRSQIGGDEIGQANIIAGNRGVGVMLRGAVDNHIEGNSIGINAGGNTVGNAGNGVRIIGSRNVSVVGNTISGNQTVGLFLGGIYSTNAVVEGNRIGSDKSGNFDRGNGTIGMILNGATDAQIRGNVISGNDAGGFFSVGGETRYTFVGNDVGTSINGASGLANQRFAAYVASSGNTFGTLANTSLGSVSLGDSFVGNHFGVASSDVFITVTGSRNVFLKNKIGSLDWTPALAGAVTKPRIGIFFGRSSTANEVHENQFSWIRTGVRYFNADAVSGLNVEQENQFDAGAVNRPLVAG